MATKAPIDTSTHLNFILSSLSNIDGDIKIDWNQVAKDNKIGYARNAATKFKETIKKYGYKFENNTITKIDDDSGSGADSRVRSSATTAAPATPKITTTTSSSRGPRAKKSTSAIAAKKNGNGAGSIKQPSVKKRKLTDTDVAVTAGEEEDDDDDGNDDIDGDAMKKENSDGLVKTEADSEVEDDIELID